MVQSTGIHHLVKGGLHAVIKDKPALITQMFRTYWGLNVTMEQADGGLFLLTEGSQKLYIAHSERYIHYVTGLSDRLNRMHWGYFLDHVDFADGDVLIDVGANVGEVGLGTLLNNRGKGLRVIACEPQTKEGAAIVRNLAGNDHVLVSAPLWKEETEIDWYVAPVQGDSSLIQPGHFEAKEKRRTTTIAALLAKHDISRVKALKVETEGAEPEVLEGALPVIDRIEYITVEMSGERGVNNETTIVPCANFLFAHGFRAVAFRESRTIMLFKNTRFD